MGLRRFDQMRCQRAQRAELTANQCQLGLHQSLTFIDFFWHLFQRIRQCFLIVTLHGHRLLGRQTLSNLIDAVGDTLPCAFD